MSVNIDPVFASALNLSEKIQDCYDKDTKGRNNQEIADKLKVKVNEFSIARQMLFNQFAELLNTCPEDQLRGLDNELFQIHAKIEELSEMQKRIEEAAHLTLRKRKGSPVQDVRDPKKYDLCMESTHHFISEEVIISEEVNQAAFDILPQIAGAPSNQEESTSNPIEEKNLTEQANEANEIARIMGGDFFDSIQEDVMEEPYNQEYEKYIGKQPQANHAPKRQALSQTKSKEELLAALERNDGLELRKLLPRLHPNVREAFYREINKLLLFNGVEPMTSRLIDFINSEKETITEHVALEVCISAAIDIELSEEITSVPQPQQPSSSSGVKNTVQPEQPILIDDVEDTPPQPSSSNGVRSAAQPEQPLRFNEIEDAAQQEVAESPIEVRHQDKADLLASLEINNQEQIRAIFLRLCPEIRSAFYNEINRLLFRQNKQVLPDFFIAMCNSGEIAITENLHASICIQAANAISVLGKNTLYNQDE